MSAIDMLHVHRSGAVAPGHHAALVRVARENELGSRSFLISGRGEALPNLHHLLLPYTQTRTITLMVQEALREWADDFRYFGSNPKPNPNPNPNPHPEPKPKPNLTQVRGHVVQQDV